MPEVEWRSSVVRRRSDGRTHARTDGVRDHASTLYLCGKDAWFWLLLNSAFATVHDRGPKEARVRFESAHIEERSIRVPEEHSKTPKNALVERLLDAREPRSSHLDVLRRDTPVLKKLAAVELVEKGVLRVEKAKW